MLANEIAEYDCADLADRSELIQTPPNIVFPDGERSFKLLS